MAGFRDFRTGEVLTAANVNDFLAKQSVMKFADASARDTALGTAVGGSNALREGMVAYLDDTNDLLKYDGSAWDDVGGGVIIAVKHALFTGTQTNSTAGGANFAVTDLSITHTLADSSNKLIISAHLGIAASSVGFGLVGVSVEDGGTPIGVGDTAGSRPRVAAAARTGSSSSFVMINPSMTFVYEPGDTASHTYTVHATCIDTTTRTIYINRAEDDSDASNRPRGVSSLVIQEVKV